MINFDYLTNAPNLSKIKYCFTIRHKKYALALVNTLNNIKFESYNDFEIFVLDDEAKRVLDQFKLPYRNSYGIDVYNDKVLNAITLSSENPDTLIMAIDCIIYLNYKKLNKELSKQWTKTNNTIYHKTYQDIGLKTDSGQKPNYIAAYMLGYYNMSKSMIKKYYNTLWTTRNMLIYTSEISRKRYEQECKITEENVLYQNRSKFNLKRFNILPNAPILDSIVLFQGTYLIDMFIKLNGCLLSMNRYDLDKDILDMLIEDDSKRKTE